MTDFFNLVKVHFLSLFGINKTLHSKKGKLTGLGGLAILLLGMAVLIGALGYIYTDVFALGTRSVISLLAIMLSYDVFMMIFLAFYTTGNVLYSYKDYDLLASMPIKTHYIVLSKLVVLYLSDLAFSLCFITGVVIKAVSMGFSVAVLKLYLVILFIPAIPLAVAILLGFLVTLISSAFRKKGTAQALIYFLIIAAFIVYSLVSEDGMMGIAFFLTQPIEKILTEWKYLLIFIAISLVALSVVILVVCITYEAMNSIVTRTRTKKNFKFKNYQGRSLFLALYLKETKRLFSCAVYVMNSVVGPVISILLAILLTQINGDPVLYFIVPIIYCFTYILAPTTNCSISMEGNTFWLIKSAPISTKMLLNVKLIVGATYGVLPALICSTVISFSMGGGFLLGAVNVLTAISIAFMGITVGLVLNVLFPIFDWETPNKPVKQSLSVFLTIMVAFVFTVLTVVFLIYTPFALGQEIYHLLVIFGVTLIIGIALYIFLMIKGESILYKKD